jgi:hypothetical protein
MPPLIERNGLYEYTGPSGTIIFPKDDATILANIRATDPEANTVEKYVPKDGVSLAAFKSHMVDLEDGAIYERAETESAKWPAKVRIQWANGAIIRRNNYPNFGSTFGYC